MPSPPSDASAGDGVRLEWCIASDVREIDAIVRAVAGACAAAGYPSRACRLNVPVALTEALANAIMRGNGGDASRQVRVSAVVGHEALSVEVTDEGRGFDAEQARVMCNDPDWLEREDGRGVFLMFALMDAVESWCDVGHTVRLLLRRS
jgi:serine/threonine-protein kinase RsbW